MSLPPGFLDELRNRTSLAHVAGRKVLWDTRKSNLGKGDLWAPCPFHQEKTASFHVDDRKGYYYCFGCHAKGDAISFVRETENVGFMEAVEILAGEAGMEMPQRDPRAQEKADRRTGLVDVMEQAVQFYRLQLKTAAGAEARAYLARRGLDEAALARWEIGFAPPGWESLRTALAGRGVALEDLLACGLVKPSDRGRAPYDVFRNRILFPIRDGRGRAIAFGGRAMDPNDTAKYLNSPETELFDKSRTLFNLKPAREACGKGQTLIVAEGYMDVIALSEAGFAAAVAPLGTAVTEPQMQLMWRMADEPVIALDGDKAGLRAAYRVIDLALPLLQAGKSLRFAIMPDGQDPDDLLRSRGPEAVKRVLDGALPMVQLMWRRETEGRVLDSPERKAALDKALRVQIARIPDPDLRHHYSAAVKELRWQHFRKPAAARQRMSFRAAPIAAPRDATRASLLVAGDAQAHERMREAVVLAALYCAPQFLTEFEASLETLTCRDPDLARLRDALLARAGDSPEAVQAHAAQAIGTEGVERLLSSPHVAVVPCIRHSSDPVLARQTVAEELAKLSAESGLAAEIAEAQTDLEDLPDEAVTWRLAQAAKARDEAVGARHDEDVEYEIAPNGAQIDRTERGALDALLARIRFSKTGRG